MAEAQQEAASAHGSIVSEQDGGQLVSHASDHSIDAAHSLHVGSQPVEEGGYGATPDAIATNSVPPLQMFSGDDVHTEDGSFHRWLEQLKIGRRLPEVD